MALDVAKLKQAQEELKKRSSGSQLWITLSKLEAGEALEFRIMDPLPEMEGIYYVEVPVWWINGKRVPSPRLLDPGTPDIIDKVIAEAKLSGDATVNKLLKATGDNKQLKVEMKYEYWIPILKFNWEFGSDEQIKGIYDDKGKVIVENIRKYVEDDRVKLLVVSIGPLKSINEIATKRGGSSMTEMTTGFNLALTKSGKGRDTKYSTVKSDVLPMPEHYYLDANSLNPFLMAKSQLLTDEYMDAIIGNYLYGEEAPEKPDETDYRYPELREQLKHALEGDDSEEERPTRPTRPGRGAPVEEAPRRGAVSKEEPETQANEGAAQEATTTRRRGSIPEATKETSYPAGRRSRAEGPSGPAPTAPAARPSGRPGRNLLNDLADVD